MLNQVDEFEGMEQEITQLRRLIYNSNNIGENSVFYSTQGIENSQENLFRHLHNVLNGFRYLNTINLSTFKSAEYARAIELIEKIESSLDTLLTSKEISPESKDQIVTALNSLKFENPPRGLRTAANRLAAKVDAAKNLNLNEPAIISAPGFFERVFNRIVKFMDGNTNKSPRQNEIYMQKDNISESYKIFKKEDDDKKEREEREEREEAERKAAEEEANKSPLKTGLETVKQSATKLGDTIAHALHLPTKEEREIKARKKKLEKFKKASQSNPNLFAELEKSKTEKVKFALPKIARKQKTRNTSEVITPKAIESSLQDEQAIREKREQRKLAQKLNKAARKIAREKRLALGNSKKATPIEKDTATRKSITMESVESVDEQASKEEALTTQAPPVIIPLAVEKVEPVAAVTKKVKLEKSPKIINLKEQAPPAQAHISTAPAERKLEKSKASSNLKGQIETEIPTQATQPAPTVSEKKAGFFAKAKKDKRSKTNKTTKKGPPSGTKAGK